MSDDHAFLRAVMANPADKLLRLVYADWLDERGDPRGEYLRVQIRLDETSSLDEQYQPLRARSEELLAVIPENWVAALGGPAWCVAANVVHERQYGPAGAEIRRGTKHFAPGAKVYVVDFFWGMGGEDVTVVGRHRKSKRYLALTMKAKHLANWRAELVYSPAVIREITRSWEFGSHRGGDAAKARAEEIVAMYNRRGAATQPFVTRPPNPERGQSKETNGE